ncbi:MAG: hydrogenase nickel incorporation protein HypB [Spirochaetes bacterium]|jgi:hydrogenase nickel incorporation protein HypB|nr:hydrogenase nickel incorporation protein HypB [Spirochaetota bacterium]
MEIRVLKDIMESNREMASDIKSLLKSKKIYMINIISSPGSGKTTMIDRIISSLKGKYRIAVIEGDVKTTQDAERLSRHDIQLIQIETERFGGGCHLESSWIMKCFESFDLDNTDLIIIENIGNLVCPAEFELGDDERMVVLSVTEGEDKPIKYPLVFNTSKTMVLNKIDLLPYLDYKLDRMSEYLKRVNPNIRVFNVSSTKGDGMDDLIRYIEENIKKKKSA